VLSIPTTTLFVGIATLLVTGYIAWQQLQTARNKFRLDLFDRRFPVFEAAMKLVLIAVQEGDISDEARREFFTATRGVEFLFNSEGSVAYARDVVFPNPRTGDREVHTLVHRVSADAGGRRALTLEI
jgi:hypothetical protein